MKPLDPGTYTDSVLYTRIPGAEADALPFTSRFLGEYHCGKHYHVDRASFDHYLLLYVRSGSGYAETETQSFQLTAGDILLLDCHSPHRYGTHSEWVIQWVHFDGLAAPYYFEKACMGGQMLRTPNHVSVMHALQKMIEVFHTQKGASDLLISRWLTDLLTDLIVCRTKSGELSQQTAVIDSSVRYISDNLNQDITLESLAKQAQLSPYYFSRLFKEQTGFSPHQYLIMVRLDYSRYLLRTTTLTTKEIAFRCGFHAESNFCTRFRKVFELTPQEYRGQS